MLNMIMLIVMLMIGCASANAQLFGPIADAPQHIFGGGFGCNGNGQCSGDAFAAEKIAAATYSINYVDLIPSRVIVGGVTRINIKPVVSTGFEQAIAQFGRNTISIGGSGGSSFPTADVPSYNFATAEHGTWTARLNKTLHTDPGTGNWYSNVSAAFIQLMGVPNGQTWMLRLNFSHSMNGKPTT